MEISELGEFGLIRHLTDDIQPRNAETLRGVGDDCAIMAFDPGRRVLVTTDMLMEGIHFDLEYTPLRHLGYKSAMVNLSDVYAMNGRPRQMTVSLALSKRFSVEDLETFYAGVRDACERCGCDIVGGDTTTSLTGLAISITCIGDVEAGKEVTRSGAQVNDLICVSGDLGAAYMGLQLLEREKTVYHELLREARQKGQDPATLPPFEPDFAGREYLLERQLRPEARRDIVEALAAEGILPTAMIDISDGLSSEALHICHQSNVGCRIYEERIPLDYQTAVAAEEMNFNVVTAALNGGEDYELLFTVPLTMHDRVEAMPQVKVIGHTTRPELGCLLIGRDGSEMRLRAQGWNPVAKKDS